MACYALWQKGKNRVEQGKAIALRICSIKDCDKKHFGRGYCKRHYSQLIENANKKTKEKVEKIKPEIECLFCKKTFFAYKTHIGNRKFCSHSCYVKMNTNEFIIKNGYKKVLKPDHARADSKGYVREHIVVMEEELKRPLKKSEVIHHIDNDKGNNSLKNLMLFPNNTAHLKYHFEMSIIEKKK